MDDKMQDWVTKIVNDVLEKRTITNTATAMPIGYNPLEYIRSALFHWIAVPFNGVERWCQLRCPNALQIELCGDITNITLEKQKILKEGESPQFSLEEKIQVRNFQEELCKITFNIPTYNKIASLVGLDDFIISEKKNELEQLKIKFEAHKAEMTETDKVDLGELIQKLEVQIGYILPDDTMAFITNWAMGNDISDIKKITKEKFLRAASLAKLHGKAPSDYLSGVFTDFNKHEIDTYAAMVLDEHMKEHQAVENGKHNWKGGESLPKPRG